MGGNHEDGREGRGEAGSCREGEKGRREKPREAVHLHMEPKDTQHPWPCFVVRTDDFNNPPIVCVNACLDHHF